MSVLSDPALQFVINTLIALLSGAGGVIATIWVFHKQRSRKEISYQVISDAPIANIHDAMKDRVEVLLDGKPIKHSSLLVLRLWNSGNVAVKAEDYVEPIKFEFEGRTVVGCDTLEMKPDNIASNDCKVFLKEDKNSVTLSKTLLNSNEWVCVKVLLEGSKGKVIGSARIIEGKIVEKTLISSTFQYGY